MEKYQHIEVNVKGIGEEDLYIYDEPEDKEAVKIAAIKSMKVLDKIKDTGFKTSCKHFIDILLFIIPERNNDNPKVAIQFCCLDAHLEIMSFLKVHNW